MSDFLSQYKSSSPFNPYSPINVDSVHRENVEMTSSGNTVSTIRSNTDPSIPRLAIAGVDYIDGGVIYETAPASIVVEPRNMSNFEWCGLCLLITIVGMLVTCRLCVKGFKKYE